MNKTFTNPFNLTKANDYTDAQILEYWVDLSVSGGFLKMIKPTSPMPMVILGGKGSGKTHLMRYFSFETQKLRGKKLPADFDEDGYLGIYMRCEGLNANRFSSKGQSQEAWNVIFEYYMELFLAEILLTHVQEVLQTKKISKAMESTFCLKILKLFDCKPLPQLITLTDLIEFLRDQRRLIDEQVNNCAITNKLKIKILATRSRLLFGIPEIFTIHHAFKKVQFLYLIDELENFSESQQKYVFTLVRERKGPCSFRIGSRLYGIKTYTTFSGNEELKEGSEYERLFLDEQLRANPETYNEFAKFLIASRILGVHETGRTDAALAKTVELLPQMFEDQSGNKDNYRAETDYVVSKYNGKVRPYFAKLQSELQNALRRQILPGVTSAAEVNQIIKQLSVEAFPLLEKINIFLFYQAWHKAKNLKVASMQIAKSCEAFRNKSSRTTDYFHTYDHFAKDLLAQLFRDTDQQQKYCGIDSFISMSMGLPRNLLNILKHVFNWALFNDEKPFEARSISLDAQKNGVLQAAEWFYRDAKTKGEDGAFLQDSISRLAELFRVIRFSSKPVECSICSMSLDFATASAQSKKYLDLAVKYSLLIEIAGGQRDRNSMRVDIKYQLNSILSPIWDLPISRRGVLPLQTDLVDGIFDPDKCNGFQELLKLRTAGMNPPFERKRKTEKTNQKSTQSDLFVNGGDND